MIKLNRKDQIFVFLYLSLIIYAVYRLYAMNENFLSEENQIAQVEEMKGQNQAMANGFVAWKNLSVKAGLGAGDKILSGDNGIITIHFKNGLILELAPRTLITLKHDSVTVLKGHVKIRTKQMKINGMKNFFVNNINIIDNENVEMSLEVVDTKSEFKTTSKFESQYYHFKNWDSFVVNKPIDEAYIEKTQVKEVLHNTEKKFSFDLKFTWNENGLDFMSEFEMLPDQLVRMQLKAMNGNVLMDILNFKSYLKYSYTLTIAPYEAVFYIDNKIIQKSLVDLPQIQDPILITSLVRKNEVAGKQKILMENKGLTVLPKLSWHKVNGANKYIVKIFRKDNDRLENVTTFFVKRPQAIWPANLSSGSYFYQVAGYDLYNNLGPYSKMGLMQLE